MKTFIFDIEFESNLYCKENLITKLIVKFGWNPILIHFISNHSGQGFNEVI